MRFAPVALALCLGGCATINSPSSRITEGQSLSYAWTTLGALAAGSDVAVKAGQLHGPNAARVSSDLKTADALLTAATSVYQAGTDPTARIIAATVAITDGLSLVSAK